MACGKTKSEKQNGTPPHRSTRLISNALDMIIYCVMLIKMFYSIDRIV